MQGILKGDSLATGAVSWGFILNPLFFDSFPSPRHKAKDLWHQAEHTQVSGRQPSPLPAQNNSQGEWSECKWAKDWYTLGTQPS